MAEQDKDNGRTDAASEDCPDMIQKLYSNFEYPDSARPSVINLLFANPGPNEEYEKAQESRFTFPWLFGNQGKADKQDDTPVLYENEITTMCPPETGPRDKLPAIDKPVNTEEPIRMFNLNSQQQILDLNKNASVAAGKNPVRYIFDPITGMRRPA